MDKQISRDLINELEGVATSLGVELDKGYRERILGWRIQDIKKIWATGKWNGKKVLLKIRPSNSATPLNEFRESEQREKLIAEHLWADGLPAQRVLQESYNQQPEWMIREYLDGAPVGAMSYSLTSGDEERFFNSLAKLRQSLDTLTTKVSATIASRPWLDKWRSEYSIRRGYVIKHLGKQAAENLDKVLDDEIRTDYQHTLLHNDLAPQNILRDGKNFVVIDWGEVALGPEAIDWATIWSFAVFQPKLRQMIIEQVLSESGQSYDDNHRKVFQAVAARLLSSLAEYHDYRAGQKIPSPNTSLYREDTLANAYGNFRDLIS